MLSRYQTRDKADDQMLSIKSALAEKVDRAEAVPRGGRRGDDFDDVERSLHTLKMAVEELQSKSRDTAVTIEQVKAEGKRKAAVVEEMEKNVARKVSDYACITLYGTAKCSRMRSGVVCMVSAHRLSFSWILNRLMCCPELRDKR